MTEDPQVPAHVLAAVREAFRHLAGEQLGALVIVAGREGLPADMVASGDALRRPLCASTLGEACTGSEGAVVVLGDEIVSSGCVVPLCEHLVRDEHGDLLGCRHMAAVGVTEIGDPCALVLSGESGAVRSAYRGQLRSLSGRWP